MILSHWNNFRQGDAHAFSEIMQTCYQDLFKYGSRFTPDDELVKDAIQNIFLTLWKNRETIGDTQFVLFYLIKSLRREIHRQLQQYKHTSHFDEEYTSSLFDLCPDAESAMIHDETSLELTAKIKKILGGLPRRQQEVIYLRFYMNADADQIAQIMAISKQSVYNLLHDALKKMKAVAENLLISLSVLISLLSM